MRVLLTRIPFHFDPAKIAAIQTAIAENRENDTETHHGLTDDEQAMYLGLLNA